MNGSPTIDPTVIYRGTSYLRKLDTKALREFKGALVIQDMDSEPLVVLIRYDIYLHIQNLLSGILEDEEERKEK